MNRGDIVATVGRGDFSTKPRPSLIIQANAFDEYHPTLTVCPITSQVSGDGFYRVPVTADGQNNLLKDSEIEIDLLQAIRRQRIGRRIGSVSGETMMIVDEALRRWLGL